MMNAEFMLLLLCLLASRISGGHQQSDVNVQLGDLADVNTSTVAGLLSGSDTDLWWPLFNTKEHPHAFLRYMVWGNRPNGNTTGIKDMKNASLANYQARKKVEGLGGIHVSISMLAFGCVTSSIESAGCIGVVPLVLGMQSDGRHSLYSLWKANPYNVVNAIAADVLDVPLEEHSMPQGKNDPSLQLRMLSSMQTTQRCEVDKHFDQVVVKPLIDAAYKVLDGCYKIDNSSFWSITGSRNLLFLGFSNHSYWGYDFYNQTKYWLLSHESLPMDQCSEAPLFAKNTDPHVYHVCLPAVGCLFAEMGASIGDNSIDDLVTWFFRYLTEEAVAGAGNLEVPSYVTVTGFYARKENNTSIFLGRSSSGNCLMKAPGPIIFPNLVGVEEAGVVDIDVLRLVLKSVKDRYIEGHKNVFDVENGPSSEFLTSTLIVVTSFVSVIYATVPFTNNILRLMTYAIGHRPRRYRFLQYGLLALFNCGVTAVAYITAVFALARDEIVREKKFRTWALVAQNVPVNLYGVRIQAFFLIQGSSTYHSLMLLLAWIFGGISMPLVTIITLHRCNADAADKRVQPNSEIQTPEQTPPSEHYTL